MEFYKIFSSIIPFFGILPAFFYLYLRLSKVKLELFRGAHIYIYFTSFFYIFEITIGKYINQNDYYYFIVYVILEFLVLVYIFSFMKIASKFYFLIFTLFFFISLLILIRYIDTITLLQMNAYLSVINFMLVISFGFLWFKDCFLNLRFTSLLDSPFFFFIFGIIIYYSGVLTLFFLSQHIDESSLSLHSYWILNFAFILINISFMILCLWKARKI